MAICIIIAVRISIRSARRRGQKLNEALAAVLARRGWKSSLGVPQRALSVLDETTFSMKASMTRSAYTCTHTFEAQSATLHLGMIGESRGTRSVQRGTVLVATVELRAPIACRISAEPIMPQFFETQSTIQMTPTISNGRHLFVHFPGQAFVYEPRVKEMLGIVDLIFGGAEKVLEGDNVALIGPSGLVVSGPIFQLTDEGKAAVETFVTGAERLLYHCQELWDQRSRSTPETS